MTDPFSDPTNVSAYPKVTDLRGHLVLLKPTKLEEGLLSAFSKPGKPQYQDRVTADVVVLDGPLDDFEDDEFPDMFFSQARLVSQMKRSIGGMVLARLDTREPGTKAGEGNPWGLNPPTDDDRKVARKYLADLEKSKAEEDPFAV